MNDDQYEQIKEFRKTYGLSLEKIGAYSVAFNKENALKFIAVVGEAGIAISGGDVLKINRKKQSFEYTYDNWGCSPLPNESVARYISRSIAVATKYVSEYPENPDIVFDVVINKSV